MDIQNHSEPRPDFPQRVGTELISEWLMLTQDRIETFADATEDRQWIHTDPERAQVESPFGTTVAHGFLILSLLSHFMATTVNLNTLRMGVNYGLNRVRFVTPVPTGARLRAHFKLLALEAIAPMGDLSGEQLTWEVIIEREGIDKPACVAEWITRRYM
ncbi:MAG TPA: MaoC family dehydratase [Oligoflexus sp.]|uniref:MaoC family dehydratase n=1 Tax=Oligoflexus sp. TaxID=1971216 RepID=UPI002D38ADDD|nr:MaoC family dehydratase [Oligoflexus sp.]HYX37902.1 MaoC family dehydratase [Oligoflexus sp.]